ncbi:MAG: hypothetical protein ACWGSQ_15145 [Longimicrobiales bacterium]
MSDKARATAVALLFAMTWGGGSVVGQEAPTPAGHWEGAIVVPGGELGIDVDLMVEAGTWSGDISIPMQQTQDFVLSEVSVTGNEVSFLMVGVPGDPTFKGTMSEDGETISGTFTQSGQSMTFRLARTDPGSGSAP